MLMEMVQKERLDFTYIDDLVEGVVLILENENSKMETFNLTYGKSHSIEIIC